MPLILLAAVVRQCPLLVKAAQYVTFILNLLLPMDCTSLYTEKGPAMTSLLIYLCSDVTVLNALFINKVCYTTADVSDLKVQIY